MKARVVLQHFANRDTTAPEYVDLLKPVKTVSHGQTKEEWVWPVGTEVEGAKALELVLFGLAEPADDECSEACGMNAEQLAEAQLSQEMAQKGVHSKKDQEFFRAGVIKGFEGDGKGGLRPIPGPNLAAYLEEVTAAKQAEEEDE